MVAKYRTIADDLAARIDAGEFGDGDRLPGEYDLARGYGVSRGTVRQALDALRSDGRITKTGGAGSFIRVGGVAIEDPFGWTRALSASGTDTTTSVVVLECRHDPDLAARLRIGGPNFLFVERLRSLVRGPAISLERSYLPWRASYRGVLVDGLVDGSIQATLTSLGVVPLSGREEVAAVALDRRDARLLRRAVRTAFLHTEQFGYDAAGTLVEYVVSLLDPAHFRPQREFGPGSRPLAGVRTTGAPATPSPRKAPRTVLPRRSPSPSR
ncbi:MAG: GntR family transcriptional regulator [Kineosporiaceae bacterium]